MIRRLTQEGRTVHAVHDVDGHRLAEYEWDTATQTATLLREYIWMDGMAVAVVEGGQVYFVRTDHIGRPVFATDSAGTKIWEAEYPPFGGVHTSSGDTIALRFPGQWYQSESGLHQNWMRDYDPITGRYIQADPLGLVDGASVYGYALQNPGRHIDPMGLQTSGSGPGAPRPNRLTLGCLPDCEKHHPIPSAYLPLIHGKKRPSQSLVPMTKPNHRALHADLNQWMAKNCLKCLASGEVANAAFSSINSGEVIRSNFTLPEIISCLEDYWNSEGGWRKAHWPSVYGTYRATVSAWRGKGIL